MGLFAKKPESNIKPIPADTYPAVCHTVIDLGTQYSELWEKSMHKILIGWEIPSVRLQLERNGEKVDLPRAISKIYTLSLGSKSNLSKDLTSWRGMPFTKEEINGFDVCSMARQNCLLQIIHQEAKDGSGNIYANVSGIIKMAKGMPLLEPENPIVTYSMLDDGYDPPENLPGWIKDIIKKSDEYIAVHHPHENIDDSEQQEEDSIPF